jgi:hypothetical protein
MSLLDLIDQIVFKTASSSCHSTLSFNPPSKVKGMQLKPAFVFAAASLFMTVPAFCQSDVRAQQQQACEDDAYRLCPNEIPDEGQVANCLARQKAKLSPACRVWFSQPPRHR